MKAISQSQSVSMTNKKTIKISRVKRLRKNGKMQV